MDTLKEYYDWIHRLRDALARELEKESGNDFIHWQELKYDNPLIDCRVAFSHQKRTQVIRFIETGRNPNMY